MNINCFSTGETVFLTTKALPNKSYVFKIKQVPQFTGIHPFLCAPWFTPFSSNRLAVYNMLMATSDHRVVR
jgi:hypothetical protein